MSNGYLTYAIFGCIPVFILAWAYNMTHFLWVLGLEILLLSVQLVCLFLGIKRVL